MYDKYIVQDGESLKDLSNRFKISERDLLDINNIAFSDEIRAGKEIIVPTNNENYFDYYTIQKGDSIYQIAKKYNINPELLAVLNGLTDNDYIYPNQKILIPKSNYSYYITTEGDTLALVSNKFNLNPNEVIATNKTIYLMPGQLMVKKNSEEYNL